MKEVEKPFNGIYVLSATRYHVLKSIDRSINKTFKRTIEFSDDPAKTSEAFAILSYLHQLRAIIDELFNNKTKGDKNGRSKRN